MVSEPQTYYKVLGEHGQPFHGGSGSWFLPQGKRPGKWMPAIEGELVPCQNGYHVCTLPQLVGWLGPRIYEVEVEGEQIDHGDKIVVRKARLIRDTGWNAQKARLFAADCAEHVLHIFENGHPGDARPRQAIETARKYARGQASDSELAAAGDAAWAAAGAAARDAAWDAAWAAARAAARDAAWAAAWAAARAAAGAAAWDAEHQWQTNPLGQYLHGEVA